MVFDLKKRLRLSMVLTNINFIAISIKIMGAGVGII